MRDRTPGQGCVGTADSRRRKDPPSSSDTSLHWAAHCSTGLRQRRLLTLPNHCFCPCLSFGAHENCMPVGISSLGLVCVVQGVPQGRSPFFFFHYGIHSLMSGGYPPTAIGYTPTAIGYPPTAIGYPPTAIGYPPTAIGYPPTAIGYPPAAIVGRIGHSVFFFPITAPPGVVSPAASGMTFPFSSCGESQCRGGSLHAASVRCPGATRAVLVLRNGHPHPRCTISVRRNGGDGGPGQHVRCAPSPGPRPERFILPPHHTAVLMYLRAKPPPPFVLPPPCPSPGGGGGPSLAQPTIFRCSSLCCCGKTTTQEYCPKHSSGKWRACARVQGQVEQDQENLHRDGQGVGLRTLAAL